MPDSFVHLHNHTEYSMLDGAQKLKPMFAEVDRQGMPAIAMSDHGNMFGAYEFQQVAKGFDGVKPIIGIEAYVAPSSRFATASRSSGGRAGSGPCRDDGEGSKDVSGGGRFTHMTMWARNARACGTCSGCRTAGQLRGAVPGRQAAHGPGADRRARRAASSPPPAAPPARSRPGCGSNQYDEAVKAAAAYQDIFGRENYFLELMDHGLDIERDVRDGPAAAGQGAEHPAAGHQRRALRHRGPGRRARQPAVHRRRQEQGRPEPVPVQRLRLLPQDRRGDARAVRRAARRPATTPC